jgi:autotransporter-associated beta strand protein
MKRKTTASIAMALTLLLSVMTFVPTAQGQPPQRFKADPGVVTLGPNQIYVLTIGPNISDTIIVRFGRTTYTQGPCNSDGVCELSANNTYTGPTTLNSGEAASFDILPTGNAVRGIVIANSQRAQVTASIIDVPTGKVESIIIVPLLP